jgi:transketolase
MSALMNLPVNYVFTHDSVLIGEDGPTHQPIEQLITLRSIPNLNVFRPADINEVLGVWDYAIKSKNPNAIVISKNKLPKLVGTQAELVKHGAYMVKKETRHVDAVLISSGSELEKTIQISDELDLLGIHTRVVSMVSQELFDKQSDEYKDQLIPKNALVIAYELSTTNNYTKYTKEKFIIGVNEFGHSGNKDDVAEKLLVSYDAVKSRIEKIIRTN